MLKKIRLKYAFFKLKKELKKSKDVKYTPASVVEDLFSKRLSLIQPWQYENEFLQLLNHYHSLKPKKVMEIGTANGGTLFAHCKLADNGATIISVDLPDGQFGGGYPEWKTPLYAKFANSEQNLHLIRGSSHEPQIVNKVKNILKNDLLDYIFIDGDHSYEGVKKDFESYFPLVKSGGAIVFHDIALHKNSACKVDEFWNEIKSQFKNIEFVNDKMNGKFGIGVLIK